MTTLPGAILKLIPPGANDPRIQPVGVILHVAVSEGDSLYDYFNGPSGGIESHLYVRYDGTVEQYRDFEHEADAQNAGNSWVSGSHRNGFISVETEGLGPGTWTAKQLDALASIIRFCSTTYSFPIRMVPAAQPSSPAKGGVGYHSLFQSWNVNDHACPGADRVKQIPDILAAAKGDDMALTTDDIDKVANRVLDLMYGDRSIGLRDQVRQALDAEDGDESGAGAFSDRIASKVDVKLDAVIASLNALHTSGLSVEAIAAAVGDVLAARLES